MTTKELSQFREHDQLINAISEYRGLTIRDITDTDGFKAVHRARMEVKSLRVAIEKTRKAMKEESLAFGRAVDAEAKRLTEMISPIEAHLEHEESRIEEEKERIRREQEERRQQVIRERYATLQALEFDGDLLSTQRMTDEEFTAVVEVAKVRKAKLDADREEERIRAAEQAAEQARIKAEQDAAIAAERERLAKIAAEQAAEQARIKAEQDAAIAAERERLAKIAAEQAAEQARIKAEQDRIDSERRQIEEAKREAARQEELRIAKEKAAEQARIETEQRLARAAEEEAAKAKKKAEAARRAEEERPYREKLLSIATTIREIEIPAGSMTARVHRVIEACAMEIMQIASEQVSE